MSSAPLQIGDDLVALFYLAQNVGRQVAEAGQERITKLFAAITVNRHGHGIGVNDGIRGEERLAAFYIVLMGIQFNKSAGNCFVRHVFSLFREIYS